MNYVLGHLVNDIRELSTLIGRARDDNSSNINAIVWASSQHVENCRVTKLRHAACLAYQHGIADEILGESYKTHTNHITINHHYHFHYENHFVV